MNYCSLGDGKPAKARGWCDAHWKMWRLTGDPLGTTRRPRETRPCSFAGCTGTVRSNDLCHAHDEQRRKGKELVPLRVPAPVPGVATMHHRIRAARGRAAEYPCVSCGGQAAHWAYDHADPDELRGPRNGTTHPYSLDVEHYRPMCVPCHKRFDLEVAA